MNKLMIKNMALEYQMLWEVSQTKRLQDSYMQECLQRAVRDHRSKFKSRGRDLLAQKLNNYGNNGAWGNEQITKLARMVFQDKAPEAIDLGEWVSVELECVFQNKQAENTFVAFVRKAGYTKNVTVKNDGSVHPRECDCETHWDEEDETTVHQDTCNRDSDTSYGREIVLTFKYGNFGVVTGICSKLNELGCTVNKTCGLHVHFDMRHLENTKKLGTIAQRVAKAVPALKQMLPKSRSDNRFCARTINTQRGNGRGESRYSFVNVQSYQRHKTLEIRGHSGTTDGGKIVNWIKILRVIMAKPNRKEILTASEMLAKFNFDADTVAYINKRVAKFAGIKASDNQSRVFDDVSQDNLMAEIGQEELSAVISFDPPVSQNETQDNVA